MKQLIRIVFYALIVSVNCIAQEPQSWTPDFRNALRNGAKAKLTLKILDEFEQPVSNAVCHVNFCDVATIIESSIGLSDTNGIFIAEGRAKGEVGGNVNKEKHYTSYFKFTKGDPPGLIDYGGESSKAYYDSKIKGSRWLPWNPTIPVELREIRKPIPMYATSIKKHSIPNQTNMGFDCEMQDWVAPHGKGFVADFFVQFSPIDASEYDGACRLVFSSPDKDGGFIRKRKHMSSEFVSEYEAPLNGYSEFKTSKKGKLKFYENNPNDLSEEEYLIFKSRIVRDKDGVVVSANYGKIYGSLRYRFSRELKCGAVEFIYYFNPNPNDRNLEFDTDMTKNLFGDGNWQMPFPRQP